MVILFFLLFFLQEMGSGLKDKEGNPVQKPILEDNAPAFFGQSDVIFRAKNLYFYAHASHQDDGCMSKTNSLKLLYYYIIILLYYYIIILLYYYIIIVLYYYIIMLLYY